MPAEVLFNAIGNASRANNGSGSPGLLQDNQSVSDNRSDFNNELNQQLAHRQQPQNRSQKQPDHPDRQASSAAANREAQTKSGKDLPAHQVDKQNTTAKQNPAANQRAEAAPQQSNTKRNAQPVSQQDLQQTAKPTTQQSNQPGALEQIQENRHSLIKQQAGDARLEQQYFAKLTEQGELTQSQLQALQNLRSQLSDTQLSRQQLQKLQRLENALDEFSLAKGTNSLAKETVLDLKEMLQDLRDLFAELEIDPSVLKEMVTQPGIVDGSGSVDIDQATELQQLVQTLTAISTNPNLVESEIGLADAEDSQAFQKLATNGQGNSDSQIALSQQLRDWQQLVAKLRAVVKHMAQEGKAITDTVAVSEVTPESQPATKLDPIAKAIKAVQVVDTPLTQLLGNRSGEPGDSELANIDPVKASLLKEAFGAVENSGKGLPLPTESVNKLAPGSAVSTVTTTIQPILMGSEARQTAPTAKEATDLAGKLQSLLEQSPVGNKSPVNPEGEQPLLDKLNLLGKEALAGKDKLSDLSLADIADQAKQLAKATDSPLQQKLQAAIDQLKTASETAKTEATDSGTSRGTITGTTTNAGVFTKGIEQTANQQAATKTVMTMHNHFTKPNWGPELGQRLMMMVGQKIQLAEIRLDPPDLGPMEVKVRMQQEQAHVVFNSQHAVVRDALEQALPRLREMFEQNGLALGDVDVQDQTAQQGHGEGSDEGQGVAAGDDPSVAEADVEQSATIVTSDRIVDYYA